MDQSDKQLIQSQFATVCEQLISIAHFELPYIFVLLDATDNVIGSKIVQPSDNSHELDALNFVVSEGVEDGLSYPMHVMVRDANEQVAYAYLDDIDAEPGIKIVHVDEEA